MATHWMGAAANLMLGSDLTRLDTLGISLLTDSEASQAAAFAARFPMQPRNPGTGKGLAQQLQAWIAGPDEESHGNALVVLLNYGPDLRNGGFKTLLTGSQMVEASWLDLGISGAYDVRDIWKHEDYCTESAGISAELGEDESKVFKLSKVA